MASELWDQLAGLPPQPAPDMWDTPQRQRLSYEDQITPAMFDAVMRQHATANGPSLWPQPAPAADPVERDAFEAAALRTRAPYRNTAAPGSSNLGPIAESLAPTQPWEYGLALALPGESLIGRGIAAIPRAARAGLAAASAYMTPSAAEAAPKSGPLWSALSKVEMRKPLAELEHRFTDVRSPVPKFVSPEEMVGGYAIYTPSDLSRANRTVTHIDNAKLDRPVTAQGGVGFPEANPGMAWASEAPIARRLDNQAATLAESGKPVYILPMTMSPTGIDASHHVADPLAQLVQQAPIGRADATAFNDAMQSYIEAIRGKRTKAEVPDWVSIRSPGFQDYIRNLEGGMTTKARMADRLALAEWQAKGAPDVAAIRHAMSEPSLIDVPRNTSGMAISRYTPGQGLLDTTHLSYGKGVAGEHMGQWPHLVPFDVAAPDIAKGVAELNAKNFAAGKKTPIQPAYHLKKPTEGVPTHQTLDQEWLDGIMKFFEMQRR